jgi:hypothetical protein
METSARAALKPYAFLTLEGLIPSRTLTPPGTSFRRVTWRRVRMRNLLWDRVSTERRDHPRVHRLPRLDPYEFDPPSPLQIFTRLGVLLMIALAFGLVAELLARLPQ